MTPGTVNQSAEFLDLIRRLCADTGIADSAEVVRTQHVVVDGVTVAMTFGDGTQTRNQLRQPSDHLTLYFDFGLVTVEGIARLLLKTNASESIGSEECFCLHARTDAVVYRVHIALASNGFPLDLAHCIRVYLDRGRTRLRNILADQLSHAMHDASFGAAQRRTKV